MKKRKVVLKGMGSLNASHKIYIKNPSSEQISIIYSCLPYWGLADCKIQRNSSFL